MRGTGRVSYTDGNGEPCSHTISKSLFRIGRVEQNDCCIDNPYVSRFHAEMTFDGEFYTIRDLASTSGTYVNGERIEHRVLVPGDMIRLGRGHGIEMVFDLQTENEPSLDGETDAALEPMRIISPEDAVFLHTARLPFLGGTDITFDRLRSLYEFTSQLLTAQSTTELSEQLAIFLHRTLKAERCAVLLAGRDRKALEVVAAIPSSNDFRPSRSITRRVFNDNVAVLSFDARADLRFSDGNSVQLQAIRSVISAPIGSKTRIWGVCYVDNLTSEHAFEDQELDFITAVARQAGLALENLFLIEEQRRSLDSFISTLAASLDARDDLTAGHSARVGAYAAGIARTMGMSREEGRLVYYAGLLHDYGKIGIRDDVLLKPAQLTAEEYEHIKEHPLHTFRLLSKIRLPEDLVDIPFVAAAHHERWDGSGYPHGLKGAEIPLGSRIVAVADAYDALTEDRVYQEAWEPERAMEELTVNSRLYFCPEVIEAFLNYFSYEIEPRYRRRQKTKKEKVSG